MKKTTWINEAEAMEMLGYKRDSLRKVVNGRLAGIIGYTKPNRTTFKYHKESIEAYLNKNASIAV